MSKPGNLPNKLRNAKKSNWQGKVEYDIKNEDWLDLSFEIALQVHDRLKQEHKTQAWLAEKLDCSPQYVGKILKGRENLTLQTITKLESVLGINLITLASPTLEFSIGLEVKPIVPVLGSVTLDPQSQQQAVEEDYSNYQSYQVAG